MSKKYFVLIAMIIATLVVGCSKSDNPIASAAFPAEKATYESLPVGVTDYFPDGSIASGSGALGLFQLHLDPFALTGELVSMRNGALKDVLEVVDITNFLQLAPCTDCAKIKSISKDAQNHLVATIGIKHPFAPGDPYKPITGRNRGDLHVFNVEGVVISNSAGTSFPAIGKMMSGFDLVNSDGYTAYLDTAIDEFYPTQATVHPYILHFDDYSEGNFSPNNPMGFESVTVPPPSGNLVMAMGCDYDYKDYVFAVDGAIDMIFAVGCTYAVSSAVKSQRFNPEYRVPQHNKKGASEVILNIVSNDLAGGNISSTASIEVHVVDINHGVAIGDALNEMLADSSVSAITIEIPGVTMGSVNIPTTPVSGTGHSPSDPLVYPGTITNSAGGPDGTYHGLIKVSDSYTPGLNTAVLLNGMDGIERVDPLQTPLTGLFQINEFATYQVFTIDVGVGTAFVVTSPNGGERWWVGSDQEIKWETSGIPGNVLIEYSKDDFVSDINTIANDEPNDGSYMWQNIPNDKSNTVKVRITSTNNPNIKDMSDDYFSIVKYILSFSDEGILQEMTPTYDDISPALCIESDGEIKMAYNMNRVLTNDFATSYACKSNDGLNWYGFQASFYSWGGVLANHGDNTKIVADKTGNSFRYLSLYYVLYDQWSTPFTAATEMFPSPYGIDGAHVTTYISRAAEMIMDADEYIYVMGDRNNQLQFKKSEIPGHLTGGPSGAVWSSFPLYNIGQGYFSRARSIELAPDDKMYFVYYENDYNNIIRLAYNDDSTGLTWNTSTIVYDGSSTSTTGANNPGLDITPDGKFHVTFIRVNGTDNELCYVNSDDGTTWSSPVVIASMPVTFNDDPICFYQALGNDFLSVVWKGGDHIYAAFSVDNGQNWSEIYQVDSIHDINAQCDFVVTSDGVWHIAWAAKNDTHWDVHYRNAWVEES